MIKLPSIKPLDAGVLSRLSPSPQPESLPLVQVPEEDGLGKAYLCPALTSFDGNLLVLGIEQERTPLGRGLVRGLWFGREGKLWLSAGKDPSKQPALCLTFIPYRCLIAGPVFSRMLETARSLNPAADYAAVWELAVVDVKRLSETQPLPEGFTAEPPEGEPEYHLDHPSLRASFSQQAPHPSDG